MSCTSPLTVASTIRALAGVVVGLLHVRFEVGDGGFHHLGRLQHERQLHLAGAEQLADRLHPGEQVLVDDLQRRLLGHRLVEIGLQAVALSVDDALRQPLEQRQLGQFGGAGFLRRRRRHPFEQPHQLLQRVILVLFAAAGRTTRSSATSRCSSGIRFIGRIFEACTIAESRPGFLAFVQEDRVEHLARGGIEAERDVGQTQRGLHIGVALLQLADRLDGLDAVFARLFLPGGDGEGQSSR